MNKSSLIILLFLILFSFRGYAEPLWSNPQNSTPTNYDPNFISEFNVTWTNDVNMTFITISNSTTVLINNATMSNGTYGVDIYNYSVVLPAGTWNWISYANDRSNIWNSTGFTVTINKAPTEITLWLNDTTNSKSYNQNDIANFTAQVNISNLLVNLNSNYPDWIEPTNITTVYNYNNSEAY